MNVSVHKHITVRGLPRDFILYRSWGEGPIVLVNEAGNKALLPFRREDAMRFASAVVALVTAPFVAAYARPYERQGFSEFVVGNVQRLSLNVGDFELWKESNKLGCFHIRGPSDDAVLPTADQDINAILSAYAFVVAEDLTPERFDRDLPFPPVEWPYVGQGKDGP
jgi:hypothetical protein